MESCFFPKSHIPKGGGAFLDMRSRAPGFPGILGMRKHGNANFLQECVNEEREKVGTLILHSLTVIDICETVNCLSLIVLIVSSI